MIVIIIIIFFIRNGFNINLLCREDHSTIIPKVPTLHCYFVKQCTKAQMTNTWGESLCLFTAIKVNSPFCRNCIVLLKRFVISLTDRLELALGKPAEQSSTLTPHEANLAVDGNIGDNVI